MQNSGWGDPVESSDEVNWGDPVEWGEPQEVESAQTRQQSDDQYPENGIMVPGFEPKKETDGVADSILKTAALTDERLLGAAGGIMESFGRTDDNDYSDRPTPPVFNNNPGLENELTAVPKYASDMIRYYAEMSSYGLSRLAAHVTPDSIQQEMVRSGEALSSESDRIIQQESPNPEGPIAQFAADVTAGGADLGASILVGIGTRSPALAASVMGGQVYGHKYNEYQTKLTTPVDEGGKGLDRDAAHKMAAGAAQFASLAEGITELIPATAILKRGGPYAQKLVNSGLTEGIQESIMAAIEQTYDAVALEGMSLAQAIAGIDWSEVAYNGLVGATIGTGLGAMTPNSPLPGDELIDVEPDSTNNGAVNAEEILGQEWGDPLETPQQEGNPQENGLQVDDVEEIDITDPNFEYIDPANERQAIPVEEINMQGGAMDGPVYDPRDTDEEEIDLLPYPDVEEISEQDAADESIVMKGKVISGADIEQKHNANVTKSKPLTPAQRAKQNRVVDEENDDLATVLRKMGGLYVGGGGGTDLGSDFKGRLSHLNETNNTFGLPGIEQKKKGKGVTLEQLAETMAESGMLDVVDENGNYDAYKMYEYLERMESGESVWLNTTDAKHLQSKESFKEAQAEAEAEERARLENQYLTGLESEIESILADKDSFESILGEYYGTQSEIVDPKSMQELMDEAVAIDADRAQNIVESSREDSFVAAQLFKLIAEGKQNGLSIESGVKKQPEKEGVRAEAQTKPKGDRGSKTGKQQDEQPDRGKKENGLKQPTGKEIAELAKNELSTHTGNGIKPPTEKQIEADNYKKIGIKYDGLDIKIETAAGQKRKPEWPPLKHHYGDIKLTEGADGDALDVYINKDNKRTDTPVFIVNQTNKDGSFDEHKIMLGFDTLADARKGYLDNYSKGWTAPDVIPEYTMSEFKEWLKNGDHKKPASLVDAKQWVGSAKQRVGSAKQEQGEKTSQTKGQEKEEFNPTHETSDGTKVIATDEEGVWQDKDGNEIEDEYASKIETSKPVKNGLKTSTKKPISPVGKKKDSEVKSPKKPAILKEGQMLGSGETALTTTGRETTPFPAVKTGPRNTEKTVKAVEKWLIDNAIAEAVSRGDEFNQLQFEGAKGNIQQADKDSAFYYLFDPDFNFPVPKPIIKPLVSDKPATEEKLPKDKKSSPKAKKNTVFTEDAAEKARALLKKKLGQLSSGIDPEIMQAGITLAGYHIEKGARTFKAYSQAMIADLGDAVKPYLKSWYMGVKYDPRAAGFDGMDDASTVESVDIDQSQDRGLFVDAYYIALTSGNAPKNNRELRKFVRELDSKEPTQARMKEAQEGIEVAMVRYSRDIVASDRNVKSIFNTLVESYEAQPLLNIRTSTSVANQAYSTPAPIAYLASELARINSKSLVFEPTAGNGMLLIGASVENSITNEINPERADSLESLGYNPLRMDATETIIGDKTVDAVITNPPFGGLDKPASKDGYKITKIDHLIAAESLESMKDDGRAVLIIGANKKAGTMAETDRIFFNYLYSHYNIADNFEIDGKLYNRQGAGWPIRVITIAGRSKSEKISPDAATIDRVSDWNELYSRFEKASDLSKNVVVSGDTSTRDPSPNGRDDTTGTGNESPNISNADGSKDSGTRGKGTQDTKSSVRGNTGTRGTGSANRPGNTRGADNADGRKPISPEQDQLGERDNTDSTKQIPVKNTGSTSKPGGRSKPDESVGSDYQVSYTAKSKAGAEGVLVPVNMNTPMSKALDKIDKLTGGIDAYVQDKLQYNTVEEMNEALMGLQIDSVASAIYNIEQGEGIIIADQTGIGKGRQAAAVLRYAKLQGKTPVFVTVKADLFTDMFGDLQDIGSGDASPLLMNIGGSITDRQSDTVKFKNKPAQHKKILEGIVRDKTLPSGKDMLFLTYSQINKSGNTQQHVLDAITEGAVFVLDESHNAGGESNTGLFMQDVLSRAAGVTYLSATYAKRPDNLPVYLKTSMSKAVDGLSELVDAVTAGGLGLQTVISNMLTETGQLFRRERSYKGVEIATITDTENRKKHVRLADSVTEKLRMITEADELFHNLQVAHMDKEAKKAGKAIAGAGNKSSAGVDHSKFSSVAHNAIRQFVLALKAETTAQEAIASLKRNEKPVIALENTMGSFLNEFVSDYGIGVGEELSDFDYRTVLSRALARSRRITVKDVRGDKTTIDVPLSSLDPTVRAKFDKAQEAIDSLDVNEIPVSPIDWIRHRVSQAGFSIKEITGREWMVDYSTPGEPVLIRKEKDEMDRVKSRDDFNSGNLDAMILNVAGSTGISLHASERFNDQRQRHMIVAQPALDINVFMQMLGRVHRTGQVRVPSYGILNLDIPAEIRPTSVLSRKMKSLNANTSSNTDSDTNVETLDIFNKYGDKIVEEYLTENVETRVKLNLSTGDIGMPDIAMKTTGRLALLPVQDQIAFYNDIEPEYRDYIEYLDKTGQNDLDIKTVPLDAKVIESKELSPARDSSNIFGQSSTLNHYDVKRQGKPMIYNEIEDRLSEVLDGSTKEEYASNLLAKMKKDEDALIASHEKTIQDYQKYLSETSGLTESSIKGVNDAIESTRNAISRLHTGRETMSRTLNREMQIGSMVRLQVGEQSLVGVVGEVIHKNKTGSPYALSKTKITLYVNDAARVLRIPLSKLYGAPDQIYVGAEVLQSMPEVFSADAASNSRENRYIVTGNLLSAYSELKTSGQVISFSNNKGEVNQGILLPRSFSPEENLKRDVVMRDAEQAVRFLSEYNYDSDIRRGGIATRDGIVRVVTDGAGAIKIMVPKAKARGGKWFLDNGLIDITGDFVSQGSSLMVAQAEGAKAVDAIRYISSKTGLYAPESYADKAKRYSGGDARGGSNSGVSEDSELYSGYGNPSTLSDQQSFGNSVKTDPEAYGSQGDLFDSTPEEIKPGQSRDNFYTQYRQVESGEIRSGVEFADTAGDAAHIFAPLRKRAQEAFYALVLDKDKKPLHLIRHTEGLKAKSDADPLTVAAAITNTDGGRYVWYGHNHPSGVIEASQSDVHITDKINEVLDGSGVEYLGHIIVGEGAKATLLTASGAEQVINVTARPRKQSIPVKTREIKKRGNANRPRIISANDSMDVVNSLESKNALVLMDNKHAVEGVISMTIDEMLQLRDNNQVPRILKGIDTTNASAVIITSEDPDAARNLAKMLNNTKSIRVLDAIIHEDSGIYASTDRGMGIESSSGGFFSLKPRLSSVVSGVTNIAVKRRSQAFINSLNLKREIKLKVFNSPDEFVIETGASPSKAARAMGFMQGNNLYLIASNIPSTADLDKTLNHEIVAHYGLDVIDPAVKKEILRKVKNSRFMPGMREVWREIDQTYKGENIDDRAEEVIARIAETPNRNIPAWEQLVDMIVKALRKVGLLRENMTRTQVESILNELAKGIRNGKPNSNTLRAMVAWHGSPHDHDGFSTQHIGTGEGAQVYGWGLYFSSKKEVGEFYKNALAGSAYIVDGEKIISTGPVTYNYDAAIEGTLDTHIRYLKSELSEFESRKKGGEKGPSFEFWGKSVQKDLDISNQLVGKKVERPGKLYQVELAPKENEYLRHDDSFDRQPEIVQKAVEDITGKKAAYIEALEMDGGQVYNMISRQVGSDQKASEILHKYGVRGVRYLDGSSRNAGGGTFNYVIFNDSDVSITGKFNLKDDKPLPMDKESRMQRARDMGFDTDTVLYHGTFADIEEFNPKDHGMLPGISALGTYLSTDSSLAGLYAKSPTTIHEYPGGNVIPAFVRGEFFEDKTDSYKDMSEVEAEKYKNKLINKGFAGVRSGIGTESEVIVFDPKNIRSIHAAFDPSESESPKLRANIPPDSTPAEKSIIRAILDKQPLDKVFRAPFAKFLDSQGRWSAGVKLTDAATDVIKNKKTGFDKADSFIETVRHGIIDRHKTPQEFIDREQQSIQEQRAQEMKAVGFIKDLSEHIKDPAEWKLVKAMLEGEDVGFQAWSSITPGIRRAIDELGQDAVDLGLITAETYERNKGAYLHRVYKKYEAQTTGLGKLSAAMSSSVKKKIQGSALKRRGMSFAVTQDRLLKDLPKEWFGLKSIPGFADKRLVNQEFTLLELYNDQGELNGNLDMEQGGRPKKLKERVWWPKDRPIPTKYADHENKGVWTVTGVKGGKFDVWRDFTKQERESMGEILDARYVIAKTFHTLAHDISTARFFDDIAKHKEWAWQDIDTVPPNSMDATGRGHFGTYAGKDWVKVPSSVISGTKTHTYGNLAGKYIQAELWRDIQGLESMHTRGFFSQLLTIFKLNKTARNPVVHMNNVMSNMVLMDLIDVRITDLKDGLREYAAKGDIYQEALENGAFGHNFISQEIRDNILDPVLKEVMEEQESIHTQYGEVEGWNKLLSAIDKAYRGYMKNVDRRLIEAYQVEDEFFRMATYMRRRGLGDTPSQAASMARDQFLNYDIRAPWVNAARRSVLPFISYSYRAIPALATSIAHRPWKLAKYATVMYALQLLAASMTGDDDDELEREHASMDDSKRGITWMGMPRMVRMPFRDDDGNPEYLDVRRWIPAGDVFDMNQGAVPFLPSWLQMGGPLLIAGEVWTNRNTFMERDIYNKEIDTMGEAFTKSSIYALQSMLPSAPWVPGSHYMSQIIEAGMGATNWKGIERDLTKTMLSSVGIKYQSVDVESGFAYQAMAIDREQRAIKFELRQLEKQYNRDKIIEFRYNMERRRLLGKMEKLKEKAEELRANKSS